MNNYYDFNSLNCNESIREQFEKLERRACTGAPLDFEAFYTLCKDFVFEVDLANREKLQDNSYDGENVFDDDYDNSLKEL